MNKFRLRKFDPICKTCPNYINQVCLGECPPIKWINGKSKRREPLINDLTNNTTFTEDYNKVISEKISDFNERLERIKNVKNYRDRAVFALILAGITQDKAGELLQLSRSTICRIIKKAPPL